MGRSDKAADQVHVYQDSPDGELLATCTLVPYSIHGLDYYVYKTKMFPGFQRLSDMQVYILLSQPRPILHGIYTG